MREAVAGRCKRCRVYCGRSSALWDRFVREHKNCHRSYGPPDLEFDGVPGQGEAFHLLWYKTMGYQPAYSPLEELAHAGRRG